MIKSAIAKLISCQDLSIDEASCAMDMIMDGGATSAQIASFLTALRMKGETIDEIAGCAKVMREKATMFNPDLPYHIDTCGTGGDGANTFNISTVATIVAAGANVKIAKHGNRAISSKCGSADLFEALGVNIMLDEIQAKKCVEEIGLCFMLAKNFHKKMTSVAQVRSELSVRTIFNILGPLSNPSNAKGQVMGVFSEKFARQLARVMIILGVERGITIHSKDGMDEISVCDDTYISEIKDGVVTDYELSPGQFGFKKYEHTELLGGDSKLNAKIALDILSGEKGAKYDIVVLNAAVAIYIGKVADSIAAGIEIAKETIDSGKALRKLNQFIDYTNKV